MAPTGAHGARLRLWALGLAACAGMFLFWRAVVRPMRMLGQLGIYGWLRDEGFKCENSRNGHLRGCVMTRRSEQEVERQHVMYDRLTYRLSVGRSWETADSSRWVQLLDSIRTAMAQRGGRAIPCPPMRGAEPLASLEAWHFYNHDILLVASPAEIRGVFRHSWGVHVSNHPAGYSGCGVTVTVRLLTPREMARAVGQWFEP